METPFEAGECDLLVGADDNSSALGFEVSQMNDPKLRLACVEGLRDAGFSPYSKAFRDKAKFSRFYRASRKLQDSANEEEMRAGIEELFGKAREAFPKAEAVFCRVFAGKHTGTIVDHHQQRKPITFNEIINEREGSLTRKRSRCRRVEWSCG